jgi:hypothetical protein
MQARESQRSSLQHKDELARLNVTLPIGLYKKLKILALDRDTTLSAMITAMIKSAIQG